LDELGLIELLLPELHALKGLEQPEKYHIYDAYVHSLEAFKASAPDIRWAALLHDIGKKPCMEKDGNMHNHAVVGAELARARLSKLKMPKSQNARICALIENHMIDINGDMSENKLRWFLARNAVIAEDLAALKEADAGGAKGKPNESSRLREVFEKMKKDGTPLSIKMLPVSGKDLIALGVPEKTRAAVMQEFWREAVMCPALREREKALAFLKKRAGESKK